MDYHDLLIRQFQCQQPQLSTGETLNIIADYIYIHRHKRVRILPRPQDVLLFEKAATIACGYFANLDIQQSSPY